MESTTATKRKNRKPIFILIIVLFIVIILLTYWGNTTVGVTQNTIISDKIPVDFNGYKIVQLSDLHDAMFGDSHAEVVDKVKMIAPDVIFITGDFIDSNRYNLEQSLLLVKRLQGVAPMYYVTGNHEIATNDIERIKDALEDLGVRVLSDEAEIITSNQRGGIAIGGIEDPLLSYLDDEEAVKTSMNQAFEHVPNQMFKILLSHRPEQFEAYVEQGMDVIFSGHAHGGQFRIPGFGGLVSPGQGWFPTYTAGVHNKDGSQMVVSRGLGNSIIPIRIFNQPEIIVVTLQNESQ
ncbi:metallophosphoesterase [Sporosarcina beigongshangi]|uniref:metallophosphoesterase n=1 Tax=Sporosarcina beigongshangi TaxID=2782538 RepID=UPI0019392DA9|nr:metallophosphoesterase [Sporosarcina beigongshangi]